MKEKSFHGSVLRPFTTHLAVMLEPRDDILVRQLFV